MEKARVNDIHPGKLIYKLFVHRVAGVTETENRIHSKHIKETSKDLLQGESGFKTTNPADRYTTLV